jgi:anti-anti-sigma factor
MYTMKRENEPGTIRFVAEENITAAQSKSLNEYFMDEMQDADASVVLDLRLIDFVDSTGIGAIVGLARACEEKELDFRVEVSSPDILRVLKTCNLHNMFEIREVSSGGEGC